MPPLIVVPPKYVLAPDSVSVPAPILVSPPMPDIVPENVVLVLSLPVVSVAEPSVTLPAPASEPMVWLKPSRSSVAPLATVNALPAENAFAAPACSVPALTAVAPEYVLSPDSLSVPAPILVSPPLPEIVPARIAKLPLVSTVPPAEFSVTSRLEKKPERYSSVPPLKLRPPRSLPRLSSADTARVPPSMAQGVTAVVLRVSAQVLVPVFWKTPKPRYWSFDPI